MGETLFLLNPASQGLAALLESFRHHEQVREMVRAQLAAGAQDAFALVHSHLPGVELHEVVKGPPCTGNRVNMRPHYRVADAPAESIAD